MLAAPEAGAKPRSGLTQVPPGEHDFATPCIRFLAPDPGWSFVVVVVISRLARGTLLWQLQKGKA